MFTGDIACCSPTSITHVFPARRLSVGREICLYASLRRVLLPQIWLIRAPAFGCSRPLRTFVVEIIRPLSSLIRLLMNIHLKKKVDAALLVTFVLVVLAGILLHLKKHGIVLEPRPVLKVIHYVLGFCMSALAVVHIKACLPALRVLAVRHRVFTFATWFLLLAWVMVLLTGAAKLLAPVKIPHLGLIHYWVGVFMALAAVLHLRTALPWLLQKFRHRSVPRP